MIVHDPARWYLQPRPRAFHWLQPLMFPRYVFMGVDAWLPGPEDERMPEVAEGYLESGYRTTQITGRADHLPTLPFFQEAAPVLTLSQLDPGTPVLIQGMRPGGRDVSFRIPQTPRVDIIVEGTVESAAARLTNVLIEPDRDQVSFTYSAIRHELPRKFTAGVHGHIPISVQIDGDDPVLYSTPPTIRAQIEAAQKAGEADSQDGV